MYLIYMYLWFFIFNIILTLLCYIDYLIDDFKYLWIKAALNDWIHVDSARLVQFDDSFKDNLIYDTLY